VEPVPPVTAQLPPPGGPAESMQPTHAANEAPWWSGTPGPEPGPTPGTIGWLWPEDTAARPGGGGTRWRPPRRWGYRAITLVTLAAGVLVGAGLFVGIALHSTPVAAGGQHKSTPKVIASPTPSVDPTPSPAPSPAGGLGSNLAAAAAWVDEWVGSNLVACDNAACAALTAIGFPASQEVQVQGNPQAVTSASVVVVDPTVSTYINSHPALANYLTPTVLASFGQVNVQVVAPDGVAAYQTELSEDVQARIRLGQQLLQSGLLTASPAAEAALQDGNVDPSLLLMLQSLADQQPIDIIGFEDAGPVPSPGAPYRAVGLAEWDTASGLSQSAYLSWLAATVNAHATFPAPLKDGPVTLPDGQAVAGIEYAAPSQLGQLG